MVYTMFWPVKTTVWHYSVNVIPLEYTGKSYSTVLNDARLYNIFKPLDVIHFYAISLITYTFLHNSRISVDLSLHYFENPTGANPTTSQLLNYAIVVTSFRTTVI